MKNFLNNTIFVITLSTVSLLVLLNLFPAIFSVLTDPFNQTTIIPYETSQNFIPFFMVIISILIFIYFFKFRKSSFIYRQTTKILNYEINRKYTTIICLIIFAFYTIHFLQDFTQIEDNPDFQMLSILILNPEYGSANSIFHSANPHIFMERFFVHTFDSWKVVPVVVSGFLLLQTFFLSKQLSGKKLSGIISMIVVAQSPIFFTYDSSYTYNFMWVLLFLFSLYTIHSKWYLSTPSFLFAVASKNLAVVFFPITICYVLLSDISNSKKIKIFITYGVIFSIILLAFVITGAQITPFIILTDITNSDFEYQHFLSGFSTFAHQLRLDSYLVYLIIPLVFGLFFKARQGIKAANIIMVMITVSILLTGPLLMSVGNFTIQPYRHISLVIFFALGIGLLFSNHEFSRKIDQVV